MSTDHLDGQDHSPEEMDSEIPGLRRTKRARVPSAVRGASPPPPDQGDQATSGFTRRQVLFIILVNAVISALISLCVVLLFRGPQGAPAGGQVVDSATETTVPTAVPPTALADAATPAASEIPAEAEAANGTQEPAGEPSPTPEPVVHVVKPGDTISGLAFKYDVPEEQILLANRLKNPNLLQMGAELIIPVGGLPDAPPTRTAVPSATSSPIPFEPPSAELTATVERVAAESVARTTPFPSREPSAGQLQIEIAEIVKPGAIESEGVFVINIGDERADLLGWTLSDSNRNEYTFPNLRLWQGGSLMVYSREGIDDPPSSFFWGKKKAIWSSGEVATLKDAQGNRVTTFSVNP